MAPSTFLNPDWLLTVEATPDTVLRLINDETLMVKETPQQVLASFEAHKQRVLQGPGIITRTTSPALVAVQAANDAAE